MVIYKCEKNLTHTHLDLIYAQVVTTAWTPNHSQPQGALPARFWCSMDWSLDAVPPCISKEVGGVDADHWITIATQTAHSEIKRDSGAASSAG